MTLPLALMPWASRTALAVCPALASFYHRALKSSGYWPDLQAAVEDVSLYAKVVSPLGNGFSQPVIFDHHQAASVGPLLFRRRPAAIARLIIAVVIDSVNGMLGRWARPHVGRECLETHSPSLAHRNAASSVVLKICEPAIAASVDHVRPNVVNRSTRHAVLKIHHGGAFSPKAAAACCVAISQMLRLDCFHFATIAPAFPTAIANIRQRSQPPKSLASPVDSCAHLRSLRHIGAYGEVF